MGERGRDPGLVLQQCPSRYYSRRGRNLSCQDASCPGWKLPQLPDPTKEEVEGTADFSQKAYCGCILYEFEI